MSRTKYFFNQAKKNIIRNGLMSVASLFTIISSLVILGIFLIISLNVDTITEQIKDQCEIQMFLLADTSAERVEQIGNEVRGIENIKSCELYTKGQMLEEVKATMFEGREDLIESFGDDDNPFSDSYKIVLSDISGAAETAKRLEEIDGVESVQNKQDIVNTVINVSKNVQNASIVIMVLLLTVAIIIIANTVQLTVHNRRKEINIMKYIGATDRFIRIPFLFEGVIIGIAGAAIALGLMSGCYSLLLKYMEVNGFELFSLIGLKTVVSWLGIVFVLVGGSIGMVGSMISMKKYLKV